MSGRPPGGFLANEALAAVLSTDKGHWAHLTAGQRPFEGPEGAPRALGGVWRAYDPNILLL